MKKLIVMVVLVMALAACTTINNSCLQGERNSVKTDAEAQQTISPKTEATLPLK